MKPEVTIVKIGGALIDAPSKLQAVLKDFARLPGRKILVHGGGSKATTLGKRLGIPAEMHRGRRITSATTLELVVQVYAGLINKQIVAGLQAQSCQALGVSGADANLILATRRPVQSVDYGFVGDVVEVQKEHLNALMDMGFVPVFCAITHDGRGQLLNTNADTIAAEIAIAMAGSFDVTLLYCFDRKGVMRDVNDADSVVERLDKESCMKWSKAGVIHEGMLPKLDNCFNALENGVRRVKIGLPEDLLTRGEGGKGTLVVL